MEMKRKAEPDAEEMASSKGPSTSKKLAPETDNDFINETELQKSIQVSVLKAADGITEEFQKNGDEVHFDPDVTAHVSALIWDTVSGDWTSDLLAFSSHARRETVNVSDVVLLMRKNRSLLEMVSKTADVDPSDFVRPVAKRRRSKSKESSRGGRSGKTRRGKPRIEQGALTVRNSSVDLDSKDSTSDNPQIPCCATEVAVDVEGETETNHETPFYDASTQSNDCRDANQSKSPSPDLFNTSNKDDDDSFDEFFEIADRNTSNEVSVLETPNQKLVNYSAKSAKGGWSTKFSEFSFLDSTPLPRAAHMLESGVSPSCSGIFSCSSSKKLKQSCVSSPRKLVLSKTPKKKKLQQHLPSPNLTSHEKTSAGQQKVSSVNSQTLCFSQGISEKNEERCPTRQPVLQDCTNSDEEFFDL